MTIDRKRFEETERREVTDEDLKAALAQILASDAPKRPRSENREPTKDELEQRWRLDRKPS